LASRWTPAGIGQHEFMVGDAQGAPTMTEPPVASAMDQMLPSTGRSSTP
jgi:hypothetical protein